MEAEQDERIMGYFIEEAKDHLNTIEQGLIYMSNTIADPEMIDEVFRAAHSVKGGAAMLGINSIQKIAHKLEDYLKFMQNCHELVDKKLEYLLFQVFDSLQALLDSLQDPLGLTEEKASEIMLAVEPVLVSIDNHLGRNIIQQDNLEYRAVQQVFCSSVPAQLKKMLQLFKQVDNSETREQLALICRTLSQAGDRTRNVRWKRLVEAISRAIGYQENSYHSLARVVIPDLKQARELVLAGRDDAVEIGEKLQSIQPPVPPVTSSSDISEIIPWASDPISTPVKTEDSQGPEVGMAELNTLADLFKGKEPDLDLTWQAADSLVPPEGDNLEMADFDRNFLDLLEASAGRAEEPNPPEGGTKSGKNDLNSLFGEKLLDLEDAQKERDFTDLLEITPQKHDDSERLALASEHLVAEGEIGNMEKGNSLAENSSELDTLSELFADLESEEDIKFTAEKKNQVSEESSPKMDKSKKKLGVISDRELPSKEEAKIDSETQANNPKIKTQTSEQSSKRGQLEPAGTGGKTVSGLRCAHRATGPTRSEHEKLANHDGIGQQAELEDFDDLLAIASSDGHKDNWDVLEPLESYESQLLEVSDDDLFDITTDMEPAEVDSQNSSDDRELDLEYLECDVSGDIAAASWEDFQLTDNVSDPLESGLETELATEELDLDLEEESMLSDLELDMFSSSAAGTDMSEESLSLDSLEELSNELLDSQTETKEASDSEAAGDSEPPANADRRTHPAPQARPEKHPRPDKLPGSCGISGRGRVDFIRLS
ncbi:MAG: Hpt domain-containing protein [Hormoscilla sp. GM7CHS1pb]|nr:Hpt domain-containing protein [Hormoscilla sp. GM7CHS1pb]